MDNKPPQHRRYAMKENDVELFGLETVVCREHDLAVACHSATGLNAIDVIQAMGTSVSAIASAMAA